MRNFKWLLNWSVPNVFILENEIIPVLKNGQNIGKCKITFEGKNVVGEFNLSEDLDDSKYVLYMVTLPNSLNEISLEGIVLVDYYDGLEKKARKAENMESI